MSSSARPAVFASIAKPNVSISPLMYNAAFQALGLDCVYLSFEVGELASAIEAMRSMDIKGYSVSRPFKQACLRLLDDLDPVASAIGAVNVIRNVDGRLVGYNSDWMGAVAAIEERACVRDRRATVIGAGGAGRAIAYGLKRAGCRISIIDRTVSKAASLAAEWGLESAKGWDALRDFQDTDVIVNATPLGSSLRDAPVLPHHVLKSGQVVLDVVFEPATTPLLRAASQAGCIAISGAEMLLRQGVVAFELFTGRPAPYAVMRDALMRHLDGTRILSEASSSRRGH